MSGLSDDGVGVIKGVPVLAMGLSGQSSSKTFASPKVLLAGNRLEMGGIVAGSVPAQVIQLKPFGDRGYQMLPYDAMNQMHTAAPINLSVALGKGSIPYPAIPGPGS